ncbi:MAG: hypothetical protein JXQ72_11805 [Anaerolineae bacterium]|nr:hypothetical protein [Anaerolineae bacterium]
MTCILITGMGHSGTRLLVHMLAEHPDVSVPVLSLNPVAEFRPLHRFFIRSMDLTPLYAADYTIDREELRFILDAYLHNVDSGKAHCVLKLPYYPLNCLDFFVDYFGGEIVLMFSQRPVEKVVKSFLNRGEDRLFFEDSPDEIMRQVKKLDLAQRKRFLAEPDPSEFFRALADRCDDLRTRWDTAHPDHRFIDVDIEQIATSRPYLTGLLEQLGLSTAPIDALLSVVDADRLLHHQQKQGQRDPGNMLRSLTPPVVWTAAARLKTMWDRQRHE